MSDPKTPAEALADLRDVIAEELRIPQLLDWMSKHLLLSGIFSSLIALGLVALMAWDVGLLG